MFFFTDRPSDKFEAAFIALKYIHNNDTVCIYIPYIYHIHWTMCVYKVNFVYGEKMGKCEGDWLIFPIFITM